MQPARYFALLIVCFLWAGCLAQGTAPESRAPLSQDGEMALFLQPMPQEATGLQFVIDQIVALHNDGRRITIPFNFNDIKGSALKGVQKRLASAVLPPGQYNGIAIRIKQSAMTTEEGPMAQLVPGEDIVVEQPFDILPGKACALFLSISLPEQNHQSNRFAALFTLRPAAQGVINLSGYIANALSNAKMVFNKKNLLVVDVIATGQEPRDIVIDGTRARAYVAVAGDNRVEVIDLLKRDVIEMLRLSLNDRPVALALTPDGRTLVAVNNGSNTISIIDALAMIEISRISVGEGPTSVAMTPSGLKAFILNTRGSNVSVIDLSQRTLAVTIGLEGEPVRASVSRDGSRLFVVTHNSPNLAVIDLTRLAVTDKVFIGADGSCITTDSQTGLIYVGLAGPAEIVVIDPFALAVIDIFHLGGRPAFLVLESQERSLFVTLPDQGQLKRIEIISKRISTGVDVGQGANTVAFVDER
jgi:YVTN family beta-propeller protein